MEEKYLIINLENFHLEEKKLTGKKYNIIYTRQSSSKQSSLHLQLETCANRAKKDGILECIVLWSKYTAWDIGKLKSNSSLKKMLFLLENKNIEKVYIYDVSRYMREFVAATSILDKYFRKTSILSVSDEKEWVNGKTPSDILKRNNFLEALFNAQKTSDEISSKIRATNSFYKKNNIHIGPPPYGCRSIGKGINKKIFFDIKEEIEIISLIKTLQTRLPLDKIMYILKKKEIKRRGKNWTKLMLNRILNETYYNLPPVSESILDEIITLLENKEELDNWIKCDRCRKWRLVDLQVIEQFKSIPFECSNLFPLNCLIPQQTIPDELLEEDFCSMHI